MRKETGGRFLRFQAGSIRTVPLLLTGWVDFPKPLIKSKTVYFEEISSLCSPLTDYLLVQAEYHGIRVVELLNRPNQLLLFTDILH